MKNMKTDWALLVRAGAAPLDLARTRLLHREPKGLDDDGERFLASIEGMECHDVIAWMAQRGPTPRELPRGVPSNSALVQKFIEAWEPGDGLSLSFAGESATPWGIDLKSVDPDAWDDLVEQMLPKLRGHLPAPYDARQRADAIRSLHGGCELFRRLCVRDVFEVIPAEVRQRSDLFENYADELLECLATTRRDLKACVRLLIERAQKAVTSGDLRPLWVLDFMGLLGGVRDPTEVLPSTVWFETESFTLSEEERRSTPYARYPVALALRWPGEGGVRAREWVAKQVLSALRRSKRADLMGGLLWGGPSTDEYDHFSHSSDGLASELRAWMADRETFDSLMRESVDQGTSLPQAWVTIVRDLAERRDGAWERAWRWIDQTPIELFEGQSGRCLLDSPYDTARWFDLAALDINSALSARRWIAVFAPLPDVVDEALTQRLTVLVRSFDAVIGLAVRGDRRAGDQRLAAGWPAAAWLRVLCFSPTSDRREVLLSLLRKEPAVLALGDEEVIARHLGALGESEQPSIVYRPWESLTVADRQSAWLRVYLYLGGAVAAQRLLATLCDDLWRSLRNISSTRPFLEACARVIDESTRERIVDSLRVLTLQDLVAYGLEVAALFEVPLDLMAIARSRIQVCHEHFDSLPEHPELAGLLLERLEWVVREGDEAWLRALAPSRERELQWLSKEEHSERVRDLVDGEVITLVRRLEEVGTSAERARSYVTARALHGGSKHLAALFDALKRDGLRRAELIEVALTRLRDEPVSGQWSPTRAALIEWMGAMLTSRAAWEAEGVRLVDALLDVEEGVLQRLCLSALSACTSPRDAPGGAERGTDPGALLDAILVALAAVLGARARESIARGDTLPALRALRAIMELDAPSRAYRFVGPLRKLAKSDERLETAVEACEHLLRSDADRAPTIDNIARALDAFAHRRV